MAPKKEGNAKKESGRAKKAENEKVKKDKESKEKEAKEAAEWTDAPSKSAKSQAEKEEKRKAELARKAENKRLADEEAASAPAKVAKAPKAGSKKQAEKPAGPGAIAASSTKGKAKDPEEKPEEPEEFSATGLDNALDLLSVVTAKMDKASVGQQAAGLEKHPERRFKASFEAYQERELPRIKEDHPGLRLNQYKELLFKNFQKSPENPFNQTTVAYDASKDEKVEALKAKKREVEDRLRA
ncbi:DUF1014-domain-containing protein [Mycena floridula]|nr:DUF1014-domain-containing protein [Mycena floridula]